MSERNSKQQILQAAERLFAERGYARVTIRQIAAEAGVSPALVMKLGGSKQQIYDNATPKDFVPLDPQWPRDQFGVELARRIMERRQTAVNEPWLQCLIGVIDAPDPQQARAAFRDRFVAALAQRIGGSDTTARAEFACALIVGLASAVRALRLMEDDADWIIERYGAMIQSAFDEPGGPA